MEGQEIERTFHNIISQMKLFLQLVSAEARLSVNCLALILTLWMFGFAIALSSWLTLLGFVAYEVYMRTGNSMDIFMALLLVNLLSYIFTKYFIRYLLKSSFFRATRKHIFLQEV